MDTWFPLIYGNYITLPCIGSRFFLFFSLLLELLTLQSWQLDCLIALDFFKKSNVRKALFPQAMLTQVSINEWLTERPKCLFGSTKIWLEKVYRKRLITSTLRKDLLQIDGLYGRISKLRYESYDLEKEDWFELCGTCMACKDEGQRLELKKKEKWYVDEMKRVRAIVGTVVWTRTRLLKVEYKQWKSLRGRDYLSK